MTSFQAQVDDWIAQSQGRIMAVVKQSAQDVFSDAQTPVGAGGNMPVDTGFLRGSFVAGLNGTTSLSGVNAYEMAIAGMQPGDVMFGGWSADYARHVEYGARGRAGRRFAGQAAAKWQSHVRRNSATLRGMMS